MGWKRRVAGGFVAFIGFMLSPLSWWNDMFVNIPLALLFAWMVGVIYPPASRPDSAAFDASVVMGYWITNIAGLVLLGKGGQAALGKAERKYSWREFLKDLAVSALYTVVILVLIKWGVLKPISGYLRTRS